MSRTSKITLVSSLLASAGIIGYILLEQKNDKDRLYTGIAKDVQRQQQHKIENTFRLQQQIELTKHLKEKEAAQIANAEDKH